MSTAADRVDNTHLSAAKRLLAGIIAGLLAAIVMTALMLVLMSTLGIATPLTITPERFAVFLTVEQLLQLIARAGGVNELKQLGVAAVIVEHLVLGLAAGIFYALVATRREPRARTMISVLVFIVLPMIVVPLSLWPVLGTHYGGLPIRNATIATLVGMLVSFVAFERTLVLSFRGLVGRPRALPPDAEFTPPIGRRALILGGLGVLVSGGAYGLLRKLCDAATFTYDGLRYGGADLQPITPNEQFYCVTKNVVDPRVNESYWRLEITGMVKTRQRYKLERLKGLDAETQETTLMCISNGIGDGLMSNAVWKGVPVAKLLATAGVLPGAEKVLLHGVDNYTDTIPLAKALEPTTLIAYEMNGEPLPHRHGFPARVIVPGYFGEKSVKWITRLEVTDASATGYYERQGWGPDFVVPTRSRFDQPPNESRIALATASAGVPLKGVAFAGHRGISRVEVSVDDGTTWADARLDYPGTRLTWALWSYDWRPAAAADYTLIVRATDQDGKLQEFDPNRPAKSGVTGFHKIVVHVA